MGPFISSIGEIAEETNIKITSKKNVVADIPLDYLTNAKVSEEPLLQEHI